MDGRGEKECWGAIKKGVMPEGGKGEMVGRGEEGLISKPDGPD